MALLLLSFLQYHNLMLSGHERYDDSDESGASLSNITQYMVVESAGGVSQVNTFTND